MSNKPSNIEETAFFSQLMHSCSVLQLLKQVLMHSHHAIVITTADHTKGYPIVYANKVFCQHTGYELAELVGQSPRILQGSGSNHKVIAKITPALKQSGYFYGSSINYRKDGSAYPVEWNISEIRNEEGEVTHYISMQKDLTNLKRIAEQIKDTNELFKRFYAVQAKENESKIELNKQVVEKIKENEKIYNGNLRSNDNIELFEEAFFDFSPGEMGALGNKMDKTPISADQFWQESPIAQDDIISLTESIRDLDAEIGLTEALNNQRNYQAIANYMKEVANCLYFCVEFNDGALIIDEVANKLAQLDSTDDVPTEMLAMFNKDVSDWIDSVFVLKNAENIFLGEDNTIAAGNQLLALLR
ncbi:MULTISPECIES: PAS domain-containing protein [Pseudoalteromonas]|uniref:Diguanylate cyclase n=1 Tax=Pseudoalteromonas amylolytica TaxID=1859457 RepID=A0A1S1MSF2_9GAMM|nr:MULTISPECIES: PAS domain S-box protein [Pseudoalteromonas]OHU84996.1 diguanylate cyclase [Pseudoalteromonas sp. JW3]OHU90053.1 diguanylate cyclase [Pseudoalteromonas amylolytica]